MDVEKFREAALDSLGVSEHPHRDRAIKLVNDLKWGLTNMGVHRGQDFIALRVPGERSDCLIFDDHRKGINGSRLASVMCVIAGKDFENEESQRIADGNVALAGRCRNMFSCLTYPSVSVAPSDTREGHVRLNGWGEYTEVGVKVVLEALKAADEAINEWAVR